MFKIRKKLLSLSLAVTLIVTAFLLPVNARASTIYNGVDVYEYSCITDYQALKNSGVSIVIQKATEGITYNDSLLYYRANLLSKYGFRVGFYHFAHNNDPVLEAKHFLSKIKGLHSDTVLWLDIEGSWSKNDAINYTNKFIAYVQSQGYQIGIYCSASFYYDYLKGNIPNIPLWLASYGRQPGLFPSAASWQYTGTGSNAGMLGYVDKDYFIDSAFLVQDVSNGIVNLNTYGAVKADLLNVRNSNSTNSTIIGQLKHGTAVHIGNKVGDWYSIYFGNHGGWVYSSYVTLNSASQSSSTGNIADLQRELNHQGYGPIAVDNIAGPKTLHACPTIYKGSTGNITKWIQARLNISADGINGPQTQNAIKVFQRQHGLTPDGVVGYYTWKVLLGL